MENPNVNIPTQRGNDMGEYKGYKDKDKRKDYLNSYAKSKRKSFSLTFNVDEDASIIEWLDSIENKNLYIKGLIKADMDHKA